MPSFSDSIVLFLLALLLFGPKKLPVLARELGKWIGEFRRASNEFKMQMEDELRASEQADRTKQIAAMEAAAPVTPAIADPEHPHTPTEIVAAAPGSEPQPNTALAEPTGTFREPEPALEAAAPTHELVDGVSTPIPIATAGELSIMPPSTGLPVPQQAPQQAAKHRDSALSGLLHSIPETETTTHGN